MALLLPYGKVTIAVHFKLEKKDGKTSTSFAKNHNLYTIAGNLPKSVSSLDFLTINNHQNEQKFS